MSVSAPHPGATPITHYENFPVASLLCPAALRPAVIAIYHFARTADDLADEGDVPAGQRLADLQAYRQALAHAGCPSAADTATPARAGAGDGAPADPRWGRWPEVFGPLQRVIARHQLPMGLLTDLLDAFEQDVRATAGQQRYRSEHELRDYCRRSANPIGRLLLQLYRVDDPQALAQSDAICTALQLINFWQDLSVDMPRGRWYVTAEAMQRFGVSETGLLTGTPTDKTSLLIASCAVAARAEMQKGLELPARVGGRLGWELRLVIQGGLRILDKIEAMGFRSWQERPTLGRRDVPLLLWRAVRMWAQGH